jgi:hypothetical protein
MNNDEVETIEPNECGYYWFQFKDSLLGSWGQPQIAEICQGWDRDGFEPFSIKFFDDDCHEPLENFYPDKVRFLSKIENLQVLAPKLKPPEQSAIEQILTNSDIVWSKYGSDTIEALAQRIVDKLK